MWFCLVLYWSIMSHEPLMMMCTDAIVAIVDSEIWWSTSFWFIWLEGSHVPVDSTVAVETSRHVFYLTWSDYNKFFTSPSISSISEIRSSHSKSSFEELGDREGVVTIWRGVQYYWCHWLTKLTQSTQRACGFYSKWDQYCPWPMYDACHLADLYRNLKFFNIQIELEYSQRWSCCVFDQRLCSLCIVTWIQSTYLLETVASIRWNPFWTTFLGQTVPHLSNYWVKL